MSRVFKTTAVFGAATATLLLGTALLGCQGYFFLKDGAWYSASLRQVLTYDLDPRLADAIGLPILGSWHALHTEIATRTTDDASVSVDDYGEGVQSDRRLPHLDRWRLWLRHPEAWLGLHRVVSAFFEWIGVGLAFLVAAGALALLGLRSTRSTGSEDTEPSSYD